MTGSPTRVVAVHAHPDDESLATGLALADLSARGVQVHVVTCTLGEEGEVIPHDLAHLQGAPQDPLARVRRAELAAATARLGVRSHLLGEVDGHPAYRDSGMAGTPSAEHPRAFVAGDPGQQARLLAELLARLHPDAVIGYDASGGYGHPDHVRAHLVTRLAVGLLDAPPVLYAPLTPRSWAESDRAWLATAPGLPTSWRVPSASEPYIGQVSDDATVTHAVVSDRALVAQRAALACHRTQVSLAPSGVDAYALSNDVAARLSGREGYAALDPSTGRALPRHQVARDTRVGWDVIPFRDDDAAPTTPTPPDRDAPEGQ